MTKKIFKALCLVAFTVFLASVVLIMAVLYGYFSRVQQTQLRMQTQLAAQGVELGGMAYFDGMDVRDYRITWIDRDGSVLYDSDADSDAMANHLEREEVQKALANGFGESHRYSSTLMARFLYTAQRLSDGTVLRLAIAQNTVLTMLLGVGQGFAAVIVLALILSVLLARRLSRRIVQPLNEVDLDRPLANEGYEEIAPLLYRLDNQQRQLRAQAEQLELDMAEKAEAERMRREFTANVSHELKTPLQTISGYAELIENGVAKPEDVRPFAGKICAESQRMIQLVSDVISLSHLDEGMGDMRFEDTDLYGVAGAVVRDLQAKADKAGVTLALTGGPAPMSAIPQLAHSIVFNLCDNAIKYNREGGHMTVDAHREGTDAVLTVTDDGIGIPAEQQERIFERFYRVDKSRSKAIGGTGLGLSIVKHAALVLGANIRLQSEVGKGTAVTVRFPPRNDD